MMRNIGTVLRRHTARLATSLLVCLLWIPATAAADDALLWQVAQADSQWPERPRYASSARAVTLDPDQLAALRPGQSLALELPSRALSSGLLVRSVSEYVNGDVALLADSVDRNVSLVLTMADDAVFAYLEDGGRVWQLQATRDKQATQLRGWLYQGESRPAATGARDYVIPDRGRSAEGPVRRPGGSPPAGMPLSMGGESDDIAAGDGPSPASGNGIRISQSFDQSHVLVNEQMETELSIRVSNRGNSVRRDLGLDIYFIREDMHVLEAPACSERSVPTMEGEQPILRCSLSASLAPGQTREVNLFVRAGPRSQPGTHLWSTVFLDDLRHDASVNVVKDVLTDSEERGISDFNLDVREFTPTDARDNVVIDVMALYTPQAGNEYGGHAQTRINQLISVANQVYADSGIGITLRPVYHRRVDHPGAGDLDMRTLLDQLTPAIPGEAPPAFSDVPDWRDRFGADLVMLFHPRGNQQSLCGLANLGGYNTHGDLTSFDDSRFAYSLVAIDCPVGSVVAHEAGHNMGLTHSRAEDGEGGTFPWATGYGVDGQFVTVMADPDQFSGAQRAARFSSPELSCPGNLACGVDRRDAGHGADAVHTLNTVRYQVANFRPTSVQSLPERTVVTADDSPTDARIALAATTDGGRSFVDTVHPGQLLDIVAEYYVDPAHVGRQGQFHVLFQLIPDAGFMQLTAEGRIQGWNEDYAELAPFREASPLRTRETVQVLRDFRVPGDVAGRQLRVYIAYSLEGSDELVYTGAPLIVEISESPAP